LQSAIHPWQAGFAVMKPITLWLLGDGKPGHENQSLGLANALARLLPCEVHRISLVGKSCVVTRVREALRQSGELPKPDIVIGAGHATHLPLLWLARKHRAKSIVLMRPSLPCGWFSVCIVPQHDFANGCCRGNVILTRGALNCVAPSDSQNRSGRMILIGGPSKIHGWDGESLLQALEKITATGDWELTDSRRTPAGFLDELRGRLPAIRISPHQETGPAWLPQKLGAAEDVWVTEDSVSMIYEALSSGAKVGLLPVPRLKSDTRVLRGLADISSGGFITPFADWQSTHVLTSPPDTLREADRCAAWIVRHFSLKP
jgi:mitochondrial fission protein ELM1